jgi:hypothetical protein
MPAQRASMMLANHKNPAASPRIKQRRFGSCDEVTDKSDIKRLEIGGHAFMVHGPRSGSWRTRAGLEARPTRLLK